MSGRSQIHRGEEHDFNFFPPTDVGMPSKAMEILRGVNAIQQAPLGSRRPQGVPSVPVRPFSGCASTREEVEAHRQYQATREADAATAALDGIKAARRVGEDMVAQDQLRVTRAGIERKMMGAEACRAADAVHAGPQGIQASALEEIARRDRSELGEATRQVIDCFLMAVRDAAKGWGTTTYRAATFQEAMRGFDADAIEETSLQAMNRCVQSIDPEALVQDCPVAMHLLTWMSEVVAYHAIYARMATAGGANVMEDEQRLQAADRVRQRLARTQADHLLSSSLHPAFKLTFERRRGKPIVAAYGDAADAPH